MKTAFGPVEVRPSRMAQRFKRFRLARYDCQKELVTRILSMGGQTQLSLGD